MQIANHRLQLGAFQTPSASLGGRSDGPRMLLALDIGSDGRTGVGGYGAKRPALVRLPFSFPLFRGLGNRDASFFFALLRGECALVFVCV